MASTAPTGDYDLFSAADGTLVIYLTGDWTLAAKRKADTAIVRRMEEGEPPKAVRVDMEGVTAWDTSLLPLLDRWERVATDKKVDFIRRTLPNDVLKLIRLAEAVPEKKDTGRGGKRQSFFYTIGVALLQGLAAAKEILQFIGECAQTLYLFCTGRARFRYRDFWLIIQQVGADALPIVTLISFLVGLIMAFVGAVQLQQFGASIYVANLVGLAMVREMGAMMAGIIMAGRTGAAFAAQLGSMKVSEELDALKTLGVSPMEFLVLPRMLALFVMMPLLCIYANFVGILGGLTIATTMLDISFASYVRQTTAAIGMDSFATGLVKSTVFGLLVAATGCLRGMQCGSSSAAVGVAATSAVVSGITCIIVADAIFAVVFQILGI